MSTTSELDHARYRDRLMIDDPQVAYLDGKADLRMNTFDACGFKKNIVNVRFPSVD